MINENYFNGTMNLENAKDIFDAIKKKTANKKIVFVAQNYGFSESAATEVNPGIMRDDGNFWIEEDRFAGFNFSYDTGFGGWVWGLSTTRKEKGYDAKFNDPYIVFERDTIKMTHRAPAGHIIHWQIVLQD